MTSSGEQTGTLSESLLYLSTIFDQEIKDQLSLITTLLEPVLLICIGLFVGIVALSVITPLYNITQHIQT